MDENELVPKPKEGGSSPRPTERRVSFRNTIEKKLKNTQFLDTEDDEIVQQELNRTGPSSANLAEDVLDYSVDEIDTPYVFISVIGDSSQFQPKQWSKLLFQAAILETVIRAEECVVMYTRPDPGSSIGNLVENVFKNHSIEQGKFLTYRHVKTEKDAEQSQNLTDTGLCLYSHKLMTVCDLRKSRNDDADKGEDVMFEKEKKVKSVSIECATMCDLQKRKDGDADKGEDVMFAIEKYIQSVDIRIDFIDEVNKIPVVLVLAEGDMITIRHVVKAVESGMLVYVIKGSGKAADLIADYATDSNSLKDKVSQHFGLSFAKDGEFLKEVQDLLSRIIKEKWLITIFDIEKEEPKALADKISESVSSAWTLVKEFTDQAGYNWISNLYIPLAYRYIQKHKKFDSIKASSLMRQAFDFSTVIVKLLLDSGTSLRKIYDLEKDSYVYSTTMKEKAVKGILSKKATTSIGDEDRVSNYRQRLQFLRNYCRKLVGYTYGKDIIERDSELVSKGFMSEELLSELFMFEFVLKNKSDMADIFWQRCPHQLMTALIMSAFLKRKSKIELELRKRRYSKDLYDMSKSYEIRATYILDKMYSLNEQDETQQDEDSDDDEDEFINEGPVEEEFRILSDRVSVMGISCAPFEFAYNNERLDFLAHSISQRYLHKMWIGKKAKTTLGGIWNFMTAPRTKFWISYFFFLLAMICISVYTLTDIIVYPSFWDISPFLMAFTVWIVGDFIEELWVEFFEGMWDTHEQALLLRIKHWFQDIWNWLDGACYVVFGITIVAHIMSTDPALVIPRRLYTLVVVFMYARFLRVLLMSKNIGTKVIMIGYMMKDLLSFLRILAVVIIGVGVAYHANIYPNFIPLFYSDWGDRWTDARIFNIIGMPYWQIYGEPNLEDLENEAKSYCEATTNGTQSCGLDFSVPLASFIYMFFGNVLLMNLVIAMFSNRFAEVESNSERVWNYRIVSIVMEYRTRLPSPFNILIRPIRLLQLLYRSIKASRDSAKIGSLQKKTKTFQTGRDHKFRNVTPDGVDKYTNSIQFKVNTTGKIYVGLFCYPPDNFEGEMATIMIGDTRKESMITNRKKDVLVTKDTDGILSRASYREFLAVWEDASMEVYLRTYNGNATEGFIPNDKLVMRAQKFIKNIDCVAFFTSSESDGSWKFGEESAQIFFQDDTGQERLKDYADAYKDSKEYKTLKKTGYNFAEFYDLTKGRTSLLFKVRTKCDANLVLFKKPKDNVKELEKLFLRDFEMLKIVLGGSKNTKSWLTYTNYRKVDEKDTGHHQSNLTANPLWISWSETQGTEGNLKQVIKVGTGEEVDMKTIMEGVLNPFQVHFIGVSTTDKRPGNWIFDLSKTIYTPKEFNYRLVTPTAINSTQKALTFKVKAKCDAHIALCNKVPSRCGGDMYEVVICAGGSNKSLIRNVSRTEDCNSDKGPKLDPNQYVEFCLSWLDGKIILWEVGNRNAFLTLPCAIDYQILYLAVSTGPASIGYWKFDYGDLKDALPTPVCSGNTKQLQKMKVKNEMRWLYDQDEVKKKTTELKWKRSQKKLSNLCIQTNDINVHI